MRAPDVSPRFRLASVIVVFIAACCGIWHVTRTPTVNTWEIANLPVQAGPILCFGDSLVAGYGAEDPEKSYPAHLARILQREVVRLGTLGQTAEEGLHEVRKTPAIRAPLVVVTLGGNDILRRIPVEKTVSALETLFEELQDRGSVVAFTAVEGIVAGIRAEAYHSLCREHGVILVPDILDGILMDDDLRSDQIHPNGAGYRIMAERVAERLSPYL